MNLREIAESIFFEALNEVLPENLINNSVQFSGDFLKIDNLEINLSEFERVYLLGCGKASLRMAKAMEGILGKRIDGGVVISNYAEFSLETAEVFESSHPLPDEKSLQAARKLREILESLSENDFFIFLLSGGASALMEEPLKPVSINDFNLLTKYLLRSGADIYEVNCVRKHISAIKGGKLARVTRAKGIVLVISDVVGDDLEVIGSGPFYSDRTTFQDALGILKKYNLVNKVPESVIEVIKRGISGELPENPKEPPSNVKHIIIGSNRKALKKAKASAEKLGFRSTIMTSMLEGEAKEVAKAIVSIAKEVKASGNPISSPACLLFGGETTVTVLGNGKGGRNQEFCLSALKSLKGCKGICILSAGTDGIDGNSDAAGAVVDFSTYLKARDFDIDVFLKNNDSNSFFKAVGGLIETGPTGTNVMDIIIVLIGGDGDS